MSKEKLTRREFLHVAAQYAGAYLLKDGVNPGRPENPILNERISDILSQITPLEFSPEGDLRLSGDITSRENQLSIIPTHRNEVERRLMREVKLLVVHYDAGERYRLNGIERTALNTVWGLDGNDPDGNGLGPSVHWCVDNFPIQRNNSEEGGYGILQTQRASGNIERPYRGLHVRVSSENPELDSNRIRTAERFSDLGIVSNLNSLVDRGITDFNAYSLGYEQIGTEYEQRFPSDLEPPRLQMANTLSLCMAVLKQYSLSPWDIVGHHEIQQKADPGDYHMATLRFLLGVAALEGKIEERFVFCGTRPQSYFRKIERYLSEVDRYGIIGVWKEYVGFQELLDSLPGNNHLDRFEE